MVAASRKRTNLKRQIRMNRMAQFKLQEGINIQFRLLSSLKLDTFIKVAIFFIFIQLLVYNLMALLQKLVNGIVIITCTALLYYLNTNISQASSQQDQLLELTYLVGTGVALSDKQLERIHQINMQSNKELSAKSPVCFLKAYEQVVVKGKIDHQGLFNIFQPGKQFSGISTCTHYYSLLIYRASLLQGKEKVRIESILNELLSKQFQTKKESPICVYFYAYNSQITTKVQVSQIIAQQYSNFAGIIEIDGSNDNTHMFAKYTLEESKDKGKSNKVKINVASQRKGFIDSLSSSVRGQCQDGSIVLVLDKSSILLSPYSLSIINDFFNSNPTDIAVFKTLTIKHENIQDSSKGNLPSIYPLLAFKKSIIAKISPFLAKISQTSKQSQKTIDYQSDLLAFNIINQLSTQVGYANDAIIYRPTRTQSEQQILSSLFLQL